MGLISNVTFKFEEATKCLALQFLMMTSEFVLDANSNFKTNEELFLSELVRNFVSQKKAFPNELRISSDRGSFLKKIFFKNYHPLNKFSHSLLCLLESLGDSRRFTKGL